MTRIFQRVDSLDYEKDLTETNAQHTVRIWWQVDGGPVRGGEVDLTTEHLDEYQEPVERLLAASDPVPASASATPNRMRTPARRPDGSINMAAGKAYRKQMKAWVDTNKIRALEGHDRPAYITPSGAYGWPKWLERAYANYLETGEIALPASMEEVRSYEYQQRRNTTRQVFAARKGQVGAGEDFGDTLEFTR